MTLHRYRPVRRLPRGPTTESFLAQQVGMAGIERLVILRRLRRELSSDAHYIELFMRGARQVGQLRHPNVVETLEVDEEGETLYQITEYLSAEDLFSVCQHARAHERPMPTAVACQIVHDVASALAYAHDATDFDGVPLGIVHGEVNPRNVVVGYDGISKLGGFGLAQANAHHVYALPDDLRFALAYSAPERIRYEDISEATDVYALGVILHELLTGQRLFRGATPADVIKAVMEQEIAPPSQVTKGTPRELDDLVLRTLQRSAEARTPTAEAFIDELGSATQALGVAAGNDEVGEWMRTEMVEAHRRRIAAEHEAAREGAGGDPASLSEVAPMLPATETGSSSVDVIFPATVEPRSRLRAALPWIVVGVVGLLVVIGAAFLVGSIAEAPPAAQIPPPHAASPAVPALPGIVLHTVPEGTTVLIDGALVTQSAGNEGVFIARGRAEVVTIEVSLAGFETVRQTVQMPAEGRRDLRLTLGRIADEGVARQDVPHVIEGASGPTAAASRAPAPTSAAGRFAARGGTASPATAPTSTRPATLPTTGGLVIHYAPASAAVTVDGVTIAGTSPLTVADLEPGPHTLRASAPEHATASRQVAVEAGTSRTVSLELAAGAPRTASLDVVTTPSGAEVSVDGRVRGTSPVMNLQLAAGVEHRVSAHLDGHRAWAARVTPVAGPNPALMASLQREPASIAVTPAPTATDRGDIRVPQSLVGSASSGRAILSSGCGRCHGRTAGALNARRYTADQWSRYFASGRHGRRAMLRDSFSQSQLADVKAYLLAGAADVEFDRAAGVQ